MRFPFMKELSIITQENLSTRLFQTLCRPSGPLHCARLVTGSCQLCVRRGCSLGWGEQGSRVTLVCGTPKDAAGFCPSEGNFSVFNIAVTWLELNKVLFKIGREEETGREFGSWKAVHMHDTHYNHCFCADNRISGEAMCSGPGASSPQMLRTLGLKPLSLASFPLPYFIFYIYILYALPLLYYYIQFLISCI